MANSGHTAVPSVALGVRPFTSPVSIRHSVVFLQTVSSSLFAERHQRARELGPAPDFGLE